MMVLCDSGWYFTILYGSLGYCMVFRGIIWYSNVDKYRGNLLEDCAGVEGN